MKNIEKIERIIDWKHLHLIFYFIISIAVLGRILSGGYVLTLDMIFSPKMEFGDVFFGLKESLGGQIPFLYMLQMLSIILPVKVIQKILFFLILFISGISMHSLVPTRSQIPKYFAGILYVLNPFLYVRFLVGHLFIILAHATVPLAVLSFLKFVDNPDIKTTITMVLCTTFVAIMGIHTFFLLLFVYIIIFFFKALEKKGGVELYPLLKFTLFASGILLLLNLYWILPALTADSTILGQIGSKDIMVFAPKPASNLNIAFTIASMYGFWRGGYTYTKDLLPFWYLFFILILYFVVHGAITTFNDKKLGSTTRAFIIVAVVSLILGVGTASPGTEPIFNWLFEHIFFFRGFRDSHKFVALLVLSYAYLGGLGVDDFAKHIKGKGIKAGQVASVILVALALTSPFIYSYTMFGFHGQLKPIDYPESWYEVNDLLNQDNDDFNVLFFPWHMYMDFNWIENTDKRIANPAHSFFDKPIIQGDNLEVEGIYSQSVDPISKYIEFLLHNRNDITNFGEMVAPINVKYIILAKEVDYKTYDFLYSQEDLELVLESDDLIVFKNKHDTAKIYEVDTINRIKSFDDLLEVSKEQDITNALYILGGKKEIKNPSEKNPLNYTKKSPAKYEIEEPKMKYVIFTTSQGINSDYWTMDSSTTVKNLGLTPAFIVEGETGNEIKYSRFYNTYLLGYIISMVTFVALIFFYLAKVRFPTRDRTG